MQQGDQLDQLFCSSVVPTKIFSFSYLLFSYILFSYIEARLTGIVWSSPASSWWTALPCPTTTSRLSPSLASRLAITSRTSGPSPRHVSGEAAEAEDAQKITVSWSAVDCAESARWAGTGSQGRHRHLRRAGRRPLHRVRLRSLALVTRSPQTRFQTWLILLLLSAEDDGK